MIEAIRRGFPIASARWPIVSASLAGEGARAIVPRRQKMNTVGA
jgi:hypothetical protein